MQVALIYGGRTPEHEVSIRSARTLYQALLDAGYSVLLIGVTLEGTWFLQMEILSQIQKEKPLSLQPGRGIFLGQEQLKVDVAFTTIHGYQGEDGNLQGTCLLCDVPLCGCDTLSSAIGMHKAVSSQLFAAAGIPVVPTWVLDSYQVKSLTPELFDSIRNKLGNDLFIKPENAGSSVGVQALPEAHYHDFQKAVENAQRYSERVLIQVLMRTIYELECAILREDDGNLLIAGPGRVIDPAKESEGYLSYTHKYGQIDAAYILIPSGIDPDLEHRIRVYAKEAFLAIKADGYARIDFFVQGNDVYLNEINTSPGMTAQSHYPVLMQSVGYDLSRVVSTLINHALNRGKEESGRCYTPPKQE
ncbi:MAG: D-alanine--D-alanine ligase [Sphaerochaeta sp.]